MRVPVQGTSRPTKYHVRCSLPSLPGSRLARLFRDDRALLNKHAGFDLRQVLG